VWLEGGVRGWAAGRRSRGQDSLELSWRSERHPGERVSGSPTRAARPSAGHPPGRLRAFSGALRTLCGRWSGRRWVARLPAPPLSIDDFWSSITDNVWATTGFELATASSNRPRVFSRSVVGLITNVPGRLLSSGGGDKDGNQAVRLVLALVARDDLGGVVVGLGTVLDLDHQLRDQVAQQSHELSARSVESRSARRAVSAFPMPVGGTARGGGSEHYGRSFGHNSIFLLGVRDILVSADR
jgi:hypothetical protein